MVKFWTFAKGSVSGGSKLISLVKVFFLIFFFAIIFANAIIISIQAGSVEPGLREIGSRFFLSTVELNERSLAIVEQNALITTDEGFWKNSWNKTKALYFILEALFIIFIWIKLLALISKYGLIQDDSKTTAAFVVGLVIFFLLQFAFIAYFDAGPIDTPIKAFSNFGKSVPVMMKGLVNVAEKLSDTSNINFTSNYTNSTNITLSAIKNINISNATREIIKKTDERFFGSKVI